MECLCAIGNQVISVSIYSKRLLGKKSVAKELRARCLALRAQMASAIVSPRLLSSILAARHSLAGRTSSRCIFMEGDRHRDKRRTEMKGCEGTARANVVAKKDSRLLVGGESIFYETCAGRARLGLAATANTISTVAARSCDARCRDKRCLGTRRSVSIQTGELF